MKFEPKVNHNGNRDVCLNIDNLDFPDKEKYSQLLLFVSTAYTVHRNKPKVVTNNNNRTTVTPQELWDTVFYSVNQFFITLSVDDQKKIAMTLMMMHHALVEFIRADQPERLILFTHDLGSHLVQLNTEIQLCRKLELFVENNIPIGDFSDAGTRAQDTEELTFYRPEVVKLTAIVLLCKMMTPIFGVLMDYLKRQVDTNVKSVHCVSILSELFKQQYNPLITKLKNYIRHALRGCTQETQTMIFGGNTENSLCDRVYGGLFVRNFVNVNLFQPNGNLMKFVIVSIKKAAITQQNNALRSPVYARIPLDNNDGDGGNTAQSEVDSITSSKPADVVGIIQATLPKVLLKHLTDPTYEISMDEYDACLKFYQRSLIRPQCFNKFLTPIFYGKDIGGGKGVLMLHAMEYTQMVALLQMILFSMGYAEVGHLITALPGLDVKLTQTEDEDFIRVNYRSSSHYKNCKGMYEQSPLGAGGKDWDKQIASVVDELLKINYYYNTAPFLWAATDQPNCNGQAIRVSPQAINSLCSFIEVVNGVDQINRASLLTMTDEEKAFW